MTTAQLSKDFFVEKAMTDAGQKFLELCKQEFNFLIDRYGFELKSSKREAGNTYKTTYQNSTTAVIINWDQREHWIYVEFYKLTHGKLVLDPLAISRGAPIKGFYLDTLLSIRSPQTSIKNMPTNISEVESCLKDYSKATEIFAADILEGNFSILEEIEKAEKNVIAAAKQAREKKY